MSIGLAFLLGAVQGLSEFLPISSSGHLVIFQSIFGGAELEKVSMMFDVFLHFGTLIAVFIAFWPDILDLLKGFTGLASDTLRGKPQISKHPSRRLFILLFVSLLPMLFILPLMGKIESLFTNTLSVGIALIMTALVLLIVDTVKNNKKDASNTAMGGALLVGVMQMFAILPGLSRSGMTIAGGTFAGMRRSFAVKYSFLLSIPVILGANILTLFDAVRGGFDISLLLPCIVGIATAAVFGLIAIKILRYISSKGKFRYFAVYCLLAGLITIIFLK